MIIDPYTWQTVSILSIDPIARDTIAVRLSRPAGYEFTAGQYAIIRLTTAADRTIIRQYSFSSPPDAAWLELTIQKEAGGDATTWLHDDATFGDTFEISQSFGHFTFESAGRSKLFIAGRVGITPFMSYLRQGSASATHIIYSVRDKAQLCYWDELQDCTTAVTTDTQPRIDQAFLAPYIEDMPVVYICGSRQFAEAMQAHLQALGIGPSDIRRELFTL